MPATVDRAGREVTSDGHEVVTEMQLSALVAGLEEDIAHGGPSGAPVHYCRLRVVTPPNDGSPVMFAHTGTDTTNNEVNIEFDAPVGGSLAGAVVQVQCIFKAMKAGGIGTNTYVAPVT